MPLQLFLIVLLLQILFLPLPTCLADTGELEVGMVCYNHPDSEGNVQLRLRHELYVEYNSSKLISNSSRKTISRNFYIALNDNVNDCSQPERSPKFARFSVPANFNMAQLHTTISNSNFSDMSTVNVLPNHRATSHRRLVFGVKSYVQRYLKLYMQFRCVTNYYGPLCNIKCAPNERYTCQPSGTRRCRAGWSGPTCAQTDTGDATTPGNVMIPYDDADPLEDVAVFLLAIGIALGAFGGIAIICWRRQRHFICCLGLRRAVQSRLRRGSARNRVRAVAVAEDTAL